MTNKPNYFVAMPVDGLAYLVTNDGTLKQLQDLVDGFIEVVAQFDGTLCIVDDEGVLKGKALNLSGSILSERPLHGTVVIGKASGEDIVGYTLGVAEAIRDIANATKKEASDRLADLSDAM